MFSGRSNRIAQEAAGTAPGTRAGNRRRQDTVKDELAKIELFFDEVRKRWPRQAELASSRNFFALWQEMQEARPFRVPDGARLSLRGTVLDLVEDTDRVAFCTWDAEEMCPALVVEGRTAVQRVLLPIQDGEPGVEEQAPVFLEDTEVTYGERLEVVYDILEHLRRNGQPVSVRALRGQAFQKALEAVAAYHEPRVVGVMRRLRSDSRARLVERALTEYAVDEVSPQLELPLGGSYAPPVTEPDPQGACDAASPLPEPAPAGDDGAGVFTIPARTNQEVALDLELLETCCKARADHRRLWVLRLQAAEVLERFPDGDMALRVPVPDGTSDLYEGDTLNVIRHGNLTPIGELRVDVLEAALFYGRLCWANPAMPYPVDEYLCAMLRRGPDAYLAGAVSAVAAEFRRPDASASRALRAMLGLEEASFDGRPGPAPMGLDPSQARAFASSVRESNSLVLVQGPPGTGKTHLLEQVVRELCSRGRRILITAPSNTAVDNLCRRLTDLPLARTGHARQAAAPDVAEACWYADDPVRQRLAERRRATGSLILAGTPIGLLRSDLARHECAESGPFDALVFDEAGMARSEEMLLCASLTDRAICFGDPIQLPPHPLAPDLLRDIAERCGPRLPSQQTLITRSCLEWLTENRGFPLLLLNQSYRCQNPRLMRFASTLFYDARVRASPQAEYFAVPFRERQRRFPPATLRLYRTSLLPPAVRGERIVIEGKRPGLENRLEAALAVRLVLDYLRRYPPGEIAMISPYRRQVHLIRSGLTLEAVRGVLGDQAPDAAQWEAFLKTRVATVDSFQGGESDVVIISYVRSNSGAGIGFVDDPNRVNVTHTRARREMIVIADSDCLASQCRGGLFRRMLRAFERDGEVITVSPAMAAALPRLPDSGPSPADTQDGLSEGGRNGGRPEE